MNLNLSSQIVLNQVSEEFYNPKTAVDRSEITRNEKILTDIFPKVDEGAAAIANAIVKEIKDKQQLGKYCVLGLGTGQSLTPVYDELIRIHREQKVSFRNVVVFNAYEYFPLKADSAISSIHQLRERFLSKVDIPEQNVFSPDGSIAQDEVQQLCRLYEERIQSFGGIDIMLLGIGRIGNIATNEPGSGINTRSRLILIDATSREEMTMSFGGQEAVPPCSITLGIANILAARKIYLTAWGEEKADIIRQTVEGSVSEAFPASYLQTHNNCHVVVDLAAAGKLTRIIHPWLVANCKWTDKLTRAALVWLCGVTHKPILKLTNKDYNENGLSELLALYGSAYQCNIKIFNDLQHTITGWPGGKPNADDTYRPERATPFPKRVIVFSPHPDDDVISMGGTIQRLVNQGHDLHVAYETSGDIAVNDEEVTRFMH
ncbi:MAG: 6-phosphogluconolactonase, partial [Prevotella sp.]